MTTIDDVFKKEFTPISTIRREHGRQTAAVYVTAWLVSINRIFNLSDDRKLSGDQITQLTEIILHEYYYLTDADLRLVYNQILRMENFNRLDMNVITRELDDYCSRRHQHAESIQTDQVEQRKREKVEYIALNGYDLKKIGKL